jgi:hypothetical protein
MCIFGRKVSRKEAIWGSKCSWEDTVKMYITDIGCVIADWTHLAQGRSQWLAFVNTENETFNSITAKIVLTSCITVSI